VYGACTRDRDNVCLIMELMEGGNLFQRIYDRKKRRMSYLEILQVRCGFPGVLIGADAAARGVGVRWGLWRQHLVSHAVGLDCTGLAVISAGHC
jgi:hypothetical protein